MDSEGFIFNGPPALMVIDVNVLCTDPGSPLVQGMARSVGGDLTYFMERLTDVVIPNINRLADCVRSVGGQVLWVRPEMRVSEAGDWPVSYQAELRGVGMTDQSFEGCPNFDLDHRLRVEDSDVHLSKFCTSAFWGGVAAQVLRAAGITDVLVAGCFTGGGVVVNAVDATSNGFNSVIIDDATAALSQEKHERALWLQRRLYRISQTEEIARAIHLERSPQGVAASGSPRP